MPCRAIRTSPGTTTAMIRAGGTSSSVPARRSTPERYFVICPNILGGCRGTTGPNSINPATGRPYGADFPVITVGDIVDVQKRLIDHLGIDRLLAVVGGSLGGHMVLDWATRFPERVAGAVAIATSARLTSQALAFDIVGRNAILRDPEYQSGQYYANGAGPTVGLALARMLGHITYLSREAMKEKFDARRLEPHDIRTQFETKFAVGSYLAYQGDRFVERFDANSYLTLTMAIDLFDLGGNARAAGRSPGPEPVPLAVGEFQHGLALSAVPVPRDRRRPDRPGQAGELLQRREPVRPRRLPAAQRAGRLRRAGAGLPGEPGRGKGCRRKDEGGRTRITSDSFLLLLPPSSFPRPPPPIPPRASSATTGSTTTRS